MATFAARRLHAMIDNTAHIVAIEMLAAAQGIDFLRPLRSSAPVEALYDRLRQDCASHPADHYLAPDIERAAALVQGGALQAPGAPHLG
jgi:histidine ammonia-lyase